MLLSLTVCRIYRWRHLRYLYVSACFSLSSAPLCYTFTCDFALPFSLSPFYLFPPSPLLAGRLGGDKFGGGQAERGQTRSLCVHIVEQETGRGGGGVARRWWGPVGAWRRQVCQNKITPPLFFYRCQGIVNTLKKVDTPKNTGAGFLLTCKHSYRENTAVLYWVARRWTCTTSAKRTGV